MYSRIFIQFVCLILILYLGFVFCLYFYQYHLIFPSRKKITKTPQDHDLKYEKVIFTTKDNIQISAWYLPQENAQRTILFLHGNYGNLSYHLFHMEQLAELNVNLFIFDYRGYGQSSGKTTEQGTYLDAQAAWDYLIKQRGTKPQDIIIYGHSMGGGVASYLASKVQNSALILESTFSTLEKLVQDSYKLILAKYLLRVKYDSQKNLTNYHGRVLIIHSINDETIPFKHAKALYDAANMPKKLVKLHGPHNECIDYNRTKYLKEIQNFLAEL
jgi:fermentation-respiration switch protein FrsA (DUF1100 family)